MSRIAIAAAVSVLAAAGAAQAQTIDATGATSASITRSVSSTTTFIDGERRGIVESEGKGGSFEAIVDIDSNHVSFESGVAVSGPFSSATSNSGVDITLTNNGVSPISIANFGSTIIPAGLGFYLQDRTGSATDNNIFTGYGQTTSGLTFQDLVQTGPTGISNPFAYASFDFQITSEDVTLYSLSGYASLYLDGGTVMQDYGLTAASVALAGFTGVYETPNNPLAYAFAWDATDIVVPLNTFLEQGANQVIQYRTSVTAYTRTACIDEVTCLVAYSGFGDPIGRGGGVDSLSRFSAFGPQLFGANNLITGIVFDPTGPFDLYQSLPNGAVPEPATWLSMILGFGLLGSALRRRRLAIA